MKKAEVEHWIVRLEAAIDLLSGTRRLSLDGLVAQAPEQVAPDAMVDLHMEIVVSGMILEIPNPDYQPPGTGETESQPTTVRAPWVEERFARCKPRYERAFEDRAREIARGHLGERGWMIVRTELELGSLTWRVVLRVSAALWFSFQAIGGYPDFKEGVREIFEDVVEIAPEMSRSAAATSLGLEPEPQRPRPRESARPTFGPDVSTATVPDETASLFAIMSELRHVSATVAETADRISHLEARLEREGSSEGAAAPSQPVGSDRRRIRK